jgi:hypothetical protein
MKWLVQASVLCGSIRGYLVLDLCVLASENFRHSSKSRESVIRLLVHSLVSAAENSFPSNLMLGFEALTGNSGQLESEQQIPCR